MAHRKRPFDFTRTVEATSDPVILDHFLIETDRLYFYQWIAVRNETSATTLIEFLKLIGAREHFYAEERTVGVGVLTWLDQAPIVVGSGEIFTIRLTGVTASDRIKMWLSGFYVPTGNPRHRSGHTPRRREEGE